MAQQWHRATVTLVFDICAARPFSDKAVSIYTYKRPNAILCSMICSPTLDILFIPMGVIEKKARLKSTDIVFDSLQNMSSISNLFWESLQQSTKKNPSMYDYGKMFPLLIRGELISDFKRVCLVVHQKFYFTTDGNESPPDYQSPNGLTILFKSTKESKKLRQVGLLLDETIITSSLLQESIYFNTLSYSLTLQEDFALLANEPSPNISEKCDNKTNRIHSFNSSPVVGKSHCTLSQAVDTFYFVFKNIHKRVTLFLTLGTTLLMNWITRYIELRPMHLSINSTVHLSLLHDVGPILLKNSLTLQYLRHLDFEKTPGLIVKHRGLFEIIRRQILDSCETPNTVNFFFWKRLGFQSESPLRDFRASSLLALVAFRIFADQYPDILLNGSYGDYDDELDTVNHLLFHCADKLHEQVRVIAQALPDGDDAVAALALLLSDSTITKSYSYPISLSILNITHYIFTRPDVSQKLTSLTPFLSLIVSDFAVHYTDFINTQIAMHHSGMKCLQCPFHPDEFVTIRELETVPITEKAKAATDTYKNLIVDLFEKKLCNFAAEAMKTTDPMIDTLTGLPNAKGKYGPWKEFHTLFWEYFITAEHAMMPLVSGAPAPMFDALFRIIVGLTLILHKKMQRLPIETRYLKYNTVYAQLIKDFEALPFEISNVPIYTIEDFLVRLSKFNKLPGEQSIT